MYPQFILLEGIDGSGKDTFADFFRHAIYERFRYDPDLTLSIVGQPCFRFDADGIIRRFIEGGEVLSPFDAMVQELTRNRELHEDYLRRYGGIVLCIRGLLTDLGTLARLYSKTPSGCVGQRRAIDHLVILDVPPDEARRRIEARGISPTWRESIENLSFFREFFLSCTHKPLFGKSTVIQSTDKAHLADAAITIANELALNAPTESHGMSGEEAQE